MSSEDSSSSGSLDDHVLYHVFEAAQKLSDFQDNQDFMQLLRVNRAFAKAGEDYFFKNTHSLTLDESDGYLVVSGYNKDGGKSFTLFSTEPDYFIQILELLKEFEVPVREIDLSNYLPFCMEPRVLEILASFPYVHSLTMLPKCLCEGPCPLIKPNLNSVTYMSTSAFLSFRTLHINNVSMYIRSIKQAMRALMVRIEEHYKRPASEDEAYSELLKDIGYVDNLTLLDSNVYYLPFSFLRDMISKMQIKCLKLASCHSPLSRELAFAVDVEGADVGEDGDDVEIPLWPEAESKIPIEQLFLMSSEKMITEEHFLFCATNLNKWFYCSKSLTIEFSGIEQMDDFKEKLMKLRTLFKREYSIKKITLRLFVLRPQDDPTDAPIELPTLVEDFTTYIRNKYILFGYENVIIKKSINPRTIEAVVHGYDKEVTLNITIMGSFVNI